MIAFDKIEPPDLWPSTIARLLYQLVCSWSSGSPPSFDSFLPQSLRKPTGIDVNGDDAEAAICAAFGAMRPQS